jgi:DNA-binding NarL/FixJ family response regulator
VLLTRQGDRRAERKITPSGELRTLGAVVLLSVVMDDVQLLLATERPGIEALFRGLSPIGSAPLGIRVIPLDASALDTCSEDLQLASAAAVDVTVEPGGVLALCRELRARKPELPIAALVCCSHAATSAMLGSLAAVGVNSVVDLHATPEDLLRALRSSALGDLVVNVHLERDHLRWSSNGNGAATGNGAECSLSKDDVTLLALLTEGLGDQDIGLRLSLSPHTVKHRIEHLRAKADRPNRIALAAWAAWRGVSLSAADSAEQKDDRGAWVAA